MNKRLTIAFLVSGALALLIGALATRAQTPADSNLRFKQWHVPLETTYNSRIFWMQANSISHDGVWAEVPNQFADIVATNLVRSATGTFVYVFTTNRTRFIANETYYDFIPGGENGNGLLVSNASGVALEWQANETRFSGAVKANTLTVTNGVTVLGSGNGIVTLNSSNGVGGIVLQPQHNLPVRITNVFNGSNFTPGWQWFVSASNNNLITWTSGPPASSSSGSGTNLDHSPLANAKRWAYANCAGGNSFQTIGDTFAAAGGSASAFTPDANNPVGVTFTTAAAADALMGSAGNSIFMPTYNPDFSAAVSIPITNQTRMWIGLTGGSGGAAAQSTNMSPSSLHCAAFRFFSTNSANWFAVTADGSTINAVDTGITVSTNYMVFRIKKVGSTWVFHTNDVPVMTNSANLPTAVMHTSVYGSSSENSAKVHTAHWCFVQTDK